ncbi:MAG: endonuclease III [Phycisphaerae bacterium]
MQTKPQVKGCAPETVRGRRKRSDDILALLKKMYPDAHCALHYGSPLELLVATILSAQCTDVRVNLVTPVLFQRFPDAQALAAANIQDIEAIIKSTGFFRAKAKAIQQTAQQLMALYGGNVPDTMEALTALRGVGRKTANVVLGDAFGKKIGIVVDTHVGRMARRLGLSPHEDPEKVEQDLMELIPRQDWTLFAHLLISHGRKVCGSRKPSCEKCELAKLCPSAPPAL